MSFLNFLLVNVFTALLPPMDPEEQDYYECLGLPKRGGNGDRRKPLPPRMMTMLPRRLVVLRTPHASLDDIRKAYKQKSLELHPDKVAQRRHLPPEQAAAEYERVQEAYACLSDAKQRKAYHELGCSNVRYRFVRGGMVHPVALYENLQRSSWLDKTRLVGLVTVALLLVLLQPILMAAKVNQSVGSSVLPNHTLQATPWTVILIPLWVGYAFLLTFWLLLACVVDDRKARRLVICSLLQHVCWLVGCVLLALAWDQGLALQVLQAQQIEQLGYGIPLFPAWEWHELSVPFYVALLLRMLEDALTIDLIKSERSKLVTPEQFIKLQHEHTNAAAASVSNSATEGGDDAEEERLNKLEEEYTVVTVLDDEVAAAVAAMREECGAAEGNGEQPPPSSSSVDASAFLSEEELERLKVHLSPEYEALSEAIQSQLRAIGTTVLFGIPFVALVACKLQAQIKVNWWVVFVPIWVWLGAKVVSSCCLCCFASVLTMGGELVVVEQHAGGGTADSGGGDEEQGGNRDAAVAATSKEPQPQRMDAKLTASNPNVSTGDDTQTRGNVGAKMASPSDTSVKSSEVEFASPEGNMNQFNEAAEKKQPHHPTSLATSTTTAPGADSSGNNKDDKADHSSSNNAGNTETGEDDDDDEFPFDSEAFHAWQQAHAETEQSALEARAKAQWACCMSSFVLIILCLIVGKLEQNYPSAENPVNPPETAGFNAFWVLFPIFVVMGSILCCCSCLIYGAGGSSLDDLVDKAKSHGEEGSPSQEEQQQSSTIVIPMPSETPEQQSSASATANKHSHLPDKAQSGSNEVGMGGDMNDLD